MGINEQIEKTVANWFNSEKGKTITRSIIAVAAGEVIGFLAGINDAAKILVLATLCYVALWLANKYSNQIKPKLPEPVKVPEPVKAV